MHIKQLIKTLAAALPNRLKRRLANRVHLRTETMRARVTGRVRGASGALIGSGALLIALGFYLRDIDKRIEHARIFEHLP
ncbi:MAG TPA: hypothetical protein VF909_11455 [Roseiflexaceae bacterium]